MNTTTDLVSAPVEQIQIPANTQVETGFFASMRRGISNFLTWQWVKAFLHWLIISAGTMSECIFLLASIWMSLNANVHDFVLLFVSEDQTKTLSDWATAAYVALPELILGLAVVTTISHIKTYHYKKSFWSAVWIMLFGAPTLVFLILSMMTVGYSVTNTTFVMPAVGVTLRALAGYTYAFTSLIYTSLGKPQEADRLREKDHTIQEMRDEYANNLADLAEEKEQIIADLSEEKDGIIETLTREKAEIERDLTHRNTFNLSSLTRTKEEEIQRLTAQIENQNRTIENQKQLLNEANLANKKLETEMIKSHDEALQAYSQELIDTLKSGIKTINAGEICRLTGFQRRRIDNAIAKNLLRVAPKNKELIFVDSLINWLKTVQPSETKTEDMPALRLVNGE